MERSLGLSDDELVDIEEYAIAGREIPKGRRYRIRIEKEKYVVGPTATGRELLVMAGKNPPERFRIDQILRGGESKRIGLDESVDFTKPGVERFVTMPLDQTDGELRKQFPMREEDARYLNSRGLSWETLIDKGGHWLILRGVPVPKGYTVDSVIVAISITSGYPGAPLDMAYFYPPMALTSGKPIPGISTHNLDGKTWQRWSRHRTSENPWRPGVDSITTHLPLVEWWLEREVQRN